MVDCVGVHDSQLRGYLNRILAPVKTSAGLLPFRKTSKGLEVLIAHPGGPFWAKKHQGAWSVIKGEMDPGEDPTAAALREFVEETGWSAPEGALMDLGEVIQGSGKRVIAFACEAPELDPDTLAPGTFQLVWRDKEIEVPEIDKVQWFELDAARRLVNPAQEAFVDRLEARLL